jgi:ribosomal protein S18 acetylase RimI-like enzyme
MQVAMSQNAVPVLRTMVGGDEETVVALIHRAFAAQPATVPPPSALKETATNISALVQKGGGILAEVECTGVGTVLWTKEGNALRLSRLAVDPAWRRQGIALALLRMAEERTRMMGLDRLTLSTRLSLTDNRRLFAAAGYVETSFESHEGFSEPTFVNMDRYLNTS